MPIWLQVVATLASLVVFLQGSVYFFDRYFRTRKGAEVHTTLESIKASLWTTDDRVELEHRLTALEGAMRAMQELHELREKIMANVLHSPHRPELDRLLEKIQQGRDLTDAELMFAKEWLWEIVVAGPDEGVTRGEKGLAGDLYASLSVKYKNKKERGAVSH